MKLGNDRARNFYPENFIFFYNSDTENKNNVHLVCEPKPNLILLIQQALFHNPVQKLFKTFLCSFPNTNRVAKAANIKTCSTCSFLQHFIQNIY